jgi:hypothetical protein
MRVSRERLYKVGSHDGGLYKSGIHVGGLDKSGGHVDEATISLDVTEYIARRRPPTYRNRDCTPNSAIKHTNGR